MLTHTMLTQEHPLQITEPAVLIRINQKYSPLLSPEALYEVTRGVWVIGNRRETVTFAIAVVGGVVREVYAIHSWHPAGTTAYKTRPREDVNLAGRWEFVGTVAPPGFRDKYLGKSVAHYFLRGAANPITYVPRFLSAPQSVHQDMATCESCGSNITVIPTARFTHLTPDEGRFCC